MNPIDLGGGHPLVSGGLLLMLAGLGLSLIHRLLPHAWRWLARTFTVSAEVRDEHVFAWLGDWIQNLEYGERCRRLSVDIEYLPQTRPGEARRGRLIFAPGRGMHVFAHAGHWFWLERGKEDVGSSDGRLLKEYYVLRCLSRDPAVLRTALRDVTERAEARRKGKVGVHCWSRYGGWREVQLQEGRGLDTIVLPPTVEGRIVRDLHAFLESRDWYLELGIPYRRGYLFHGPPGCGKTSFAKSLASHFEMSVYLVNLSNSGMSDETLLECLNGARPESLLLIEDVDAAFTDRRNREVGAGQLTFSGLLNAIDGVAAQEGRVVVMTTNHPERLDPALVRPGRVDVEQAFDLASPAQVRELFLRFYPGEEALADRLAERVPHGMISAATLQGIFLEARGRPVAGLRGVLDRLSDRARMLPAKVG